MKTIICVFTFLAVLGLISTSAYADTSVGQVLDTQEKIQTTKTEDPPPKPPETQCTPAGQVNLFVCGTCTPCPPSDETLLAKRERKTTAGTVISLADKIDKAQRGLGSLRVLIKQIADKSDDDKAELAASIKALEVRIEELKKGLQEHCGAENFPDAESRALCMRVRNEPNMVAHHGLDVVAGSRIIKRTTTTTGGMTKVEETFDKTTDTILGVGTGCRKFEQIIGAGQNTPGSYTLSEMGCPEYGGRSDVGEVALAKIRIQENLQSARTGWETAGIIAASAAAGAALGAGIGGFVQPSESRPGEFHASGAGYGAAIGAGVGALVGTIIVVATD